MRPPCKEETKKKIADALRGRTTGRKPSIKFVEAGKSTRYNSSSPRLRGEKHPNWKGGLSPARQKEYGNPEYLSFVKVVLERDNYTCQSCGAKNGNGYTVQLEAHHKTPYGERPDLRYDTDNGITLCFDCHNLTKSSRPKTVDFVPKERLCLICHRPFSIFNPRKYCPDCRTKYCCPVCGSTTCRHADRRLYRSKLMQLT